MGNEKKGRGLIGVVIVLVLLVLGLSGYIIYDKVINDNGSKTEEPIVPNVVDVDVEGDTANVNAAIVEGYYKYGQIYSTDEKPCDAEKNPLHGETTEILFNSDGTCILAYAADCGGGYRWTGTYTINNNELTIKCDSGYGSCNAFDGKYTINEYGVIIDKDMFLEADASVNTGDFVRARVTGAMEYDLTGEMIEEEI